MGCVASRPNAVAPEHEPIPTKLHLILRWRIEEFERHRRTRVTKRSPSKKELLLDCPDNDARKSLSSPDNGTTFLESKDSKESTKIAESREEKQKDGQREEKIEKGAAKAGVEVEGKKETDMENEGNQEDDDEGMIRNEENIVCPGSPSFRIYFIRNSEDNDDDDDCKKEAEIDKTQNCDHNKSPEKNLQKSLPKKIKKVWRRSLRKAASRGGQTTVKNLFRVRLSY